MIRHCEVPSFVFGYAATGAAAKQAPTISPSFARKRESCDEYHGFFEDLLKGSGQ